MPREPEFVVDLRDPERRELVASRFLRVGACPVEDQPFPGLLVDVVVVVVLPDEQVLTRRGRVVQRLPSGGFAVQLHEPLTEADLAAPPADADHTPFPFDVGTPAWARSAPAAAQPAAPPAMARPAAPAAAAVAPLPLEVVAVRTAPAASRASASPVPVPPEVDARIRDLPLADKQRLAREGARVERQALIRDANKALHAAVVSNPAVDLDEVIEYSSLPGLSTEAIAAIVQNKSWLASRSLVLNLVKNPATPAEVAARLVPRLGPNEWRVLVNPGAARPSVAAQARMLLNQGD
jgi:hypothetical protein